MTRLYKIAIPVMMFLIACILILLFYNGILWFNNPSEKEYPVKGVDVSAYQGTIDWDVLAKQEITFAFIKATEGSSHQDSRFEENWKNAQKTSLRIGAYHFFSYDSDGYSQAQNFISTVPVLEGALPPVVDIEFYGENKKNPPSKEAVLPILNTFLAQLEEHYGEKPILYATMKSYDLYLSGEYQEYPLWIRNVLRFPKLPDEQKWSFWQYSHRERLEGYQGVEKFIDMNVWNGTTESFQNYANSGKMEGVNTF